MIQKHRLEGRCHHVFHRNFPGGGALRHADHAPIQHLRHPVRGALRGEHPAGAGSGA